MLTLAGEGIEARVLSMHTLKPLDRAAVLKAAQETRAVVTLEEHSIIGGLGGAVAESLLESSARPRIFKRIRPGFRYERSLGVLTQARAAGLVTKSNLILGMGEERAEVSQALRDLHAAGTELVTITQYLRPSARHHPVTRWVKPEEFVELQAEAEEIGFAGVLSGPLVRSSYRAGRLYRQAIEARQESGAALPA